MPRPFYNRFYFLPFVAPLRTHAPTRGAKSGSDARSPETARRASPASQRLRRRDCRLFRRMRSTPKCSARPPSWQKQLRCGPRGFSGYRRRMGPRIRRQGRHQGMRFPERKARCWSRFARPTSKMRNGSPSTSLRYRARLARRSCPGRRTSQGLEVRAPTAFSCKRIPFEKPPKVAPPRYR